MAAIIKCKMCGGDLALVEGSTLATCEFCGTQQTVPSMDSEKKLVLFERAERLRRQCEFDKAAGVYENIVADFRQEAEAYWGLVLCKFGIEYVDDPASGKKIPTCHRSSFESVFDDANYEQTMENADATARKVYREEAKAIEQIRKGILAVSNNEAPYDCFICYKETDEKGERTLDSVLAQDLYDALVEKGYRTFFSRITLEDKLGTEYEPYIFAALNSAKVMFAVGTDYEYYNAVWVKNEWSRYLKLMEADKSRHLIPCYKGIDAYDMPKEFARLQAQDLGKMGAVQDILRNMEKLIPRNAPQPQQSRQGGGLDENVSDMLSRAYTSLENEEWEVADALFEAVMKSQMSTSDRVLIEGNVRQAREQIGFQLRRKQAQRHNRILTLILAAVCAVLFFMGKQHADLFLEEGFSRTGGDKDMSTVMIILGVHLAGTVPVILASLAGALHVAKIPGGRSFWPGAARALSVIGILTTAASLTFILTSGEIGQPGDEFYLMVQHLMNWIKYILYLHAATFVLLFFRKKA